MKFRLTYPEYKTVDETKILGWYADAVANKECDSLEIYNAVEAAEELENAGLITVAEVQS